MFYPLEPSNLENVYQPGIAQLSRYYVGQDYYNLGFLNNITRWQMGATFKQDGFSASDACRTSEVWTYDPPLPTKCLPGR